MIARIGTGTERPTRCMRTSTLGRMRSIAIPNYQAVRDHIGAYALRCIGGDRAHFIMLSFWESYDAIATFAGHDIEQAKYDDRGRESVYRELATARHDTRF